MSNSLDPDQARHFVRPDLDPNFLQRLSADDKSQDYSGERIKFIVLPADVQCRDADWQTPRCPSLVKI